MVHITSLMNALSRIRAVLLVIVLGTSAYGQAPVKSPKIPPAPPVNYGHGSGIVLMDVDYNTGKVTAARILVSTGNSRFDDAALAAFRKWRFKPHTPSPVKTPITFVQHRRTH